MNVIMGLLGKSPYGVAAALRRRIWDFLTGSGKIKRLKIKLFRRQKATVLSAGNSIRFNALHVAATS